MDIEEIRLECIKQAVASGCTTHLDIIPLAGQAEIAVRAVPNDE